MQGRIIEVRLEWYELCVVKEVATRRHEQSASRGMRPQLRRDIAADYVGAMGEMAFAKATNRYWQCEVNASGRSGGDVGTIEVRSSVRSDAPLIVRNYDIDGKLYALVICQEPACWFIGWCTGEFARQSKYLKDMPSGRHYAVPQCDLQDPYLLSTLSHESRLLNGW